MRSDDDERKLQQRALFVAMCALRYVGAADKAAEYASDENGQSLPHRRI
jgi:hypothetical protein